MAATGVAALALLRLSGWLSIVVGTLGLAVAVLIGGFARLSRAPRVTGRSSAEFLLLREERAPLRRRDQLGASLDLDQVLTTALELLVGVPGVEAAAIVLRPESRYGEEHAPLAATMGMEPDELAGLPLDWPTDGLRPTRVTVAYEYEGTAPGAAIAGGVLVPLPGEETPSGTIAALWRGADPPTAAALAMVDEIARGATIPIDNARRHRAALATAEIDALTRLYNRRYFHEVLAREISRTHRYGRRLTVAILDVDGFKALNERLGHLACDAMLANVGASIRAVVRTSDVACRVGGDEFGVILTEAAAADAEHFFQRLRFALNAEVGDERLTLSAGAAELQSDDDSVKVFERADAALFKAKQSGRDQLALADNEQGVGGSRVTEESA
jgi:diguanylate cyclase (GGDEF)-like protein